MKKFIAIALLSLGLTAPAVASDAPFKISGGWKTMNNNEYQTVNLTATQDGLVVESLVTNRGQCFSSYGNPGKNTPVRFGETKVWSYMVYNSMNRSHKPCDIIEIVVNTNKGSWTFTPN